MGKTEGTIGGKPKGSKEPNPRKIEAQVARDKVRTMADATPSDDKGEFGDKSAMSQDYRPREKVLGDVAKQKREICWAIALARLLQAIYNLNLEDIKSFLQFNHDDLLQHIMPDKVSQKNAKLELNNIRKAISHIAKKGILTESTGTGARPGSTVGHREKWQFKLEQNASAQIIKDKLDVSPVVVAFHVNTAFQVIGQGIYEVKILEPEGEKEPTSHMMLLVGYGYTKDNKLFFLVQNSWGTGWGVDGYGRIIIDDNSGVILVYP